MMIVSHIELGASTRLRLSINHIDCILNSAQQFQRPSHKSFFVKLRVLLAREIKTEPEQRLYEFRPQFPRVYFRPTLSRLSIFRSNYEDTRGCN